MIYQSTYFMRFFLHPTFSIINIVPKLAELSTSYNNTFCYLNWCSDTLYTVMEPFWSHIVNQCKCYETLRISAIFYNDLQYTYCSGNIRYLHYSCTFLFSSWHQPPDQLSKCSSKISNLLLSVQMQESVHYHWTTLACFLFGAYFVEDGAASSNELLLTWSGWDGYISLPKASLSSGSLNTSDAIT